MVVLNTRKDALALAQAVGQAEHVFHLSTRLCGAHRKKVLATIKARLDRDNPQPVCLISTQVVEAGVDLDFPTVWRALGPLDRIVQAAGRCNREGLREKGKVVLFEPADGGMPGGPYKEGLRQALKIIREKGPQELRRPEVYHEYFVKLFENVKLDEKCIQPDRADLDYPEVARKYKLIEDDTMPVVVPYGDGLIRLDQWQKRPGRKAWQALQPYIVSVYRHELQRPEFSDHLEAVSDNLYRWNGEYDDKEMHLGLVPSVFDITDLVQ